MPRKTKKSTKLFFVIVLILSISVMSGMIIIWEKSIFVLILISAFLVCTISGFALTREDKNVKKHN